jgi:hypothetical protein
MLSIVDMCLWQQYKLLYLKHRDTGYPLCFLHEQNNTFNLITISSVTNFTAALWHFAARLILNIYSSHPHCYRNRMTVITIITRFVRDKSTAATTEIQMKTFLIPARL